LVGRDARQMRMIRRPRNLMRRVGAYPEDLADLHPTVDHVEIGRTTDETNPTCTLLDTSEPSEEEEHVAGTNLMPREMRGRCSRLAEDGSPSATSRERVAPQIGIEMRAIVRADAAVRELLDNPRNRFAPAIAYVALADRRRGVRNRQRAEGAIPENRARASAVARVKPLAAKDKFHVRADAYVIVARTAC
jgi:hypothetical protein